MAGNRMSEWILNINNSVLAKSLVNNKDVDTKCLLNSGLPQFDSYLLPFFKFKKDNYILISFLNKYGSFFVRAWPRVNDLSRHRQKNLKTFEECYNFLINEAFVKGRENDYDVHLGEFEESLFSGTLISNGKKVIAELALGDHISLEHGKSIPLLGIYDYHNGKKFKNMYYVVDNFKSFLGHKYNEKLFIKCKTVIWKALKYIKESKNGYNFPDYTLKKGYFCFVYTKKTNRIIFIDYKTNESYLK